MVRRAIWDVSQSSPAMRAQMTRSHPPTTCAGISPWRENVSALISQSRTSSAMYAARTSARGRPRAAWCKVRVHGKILRSHHLVVNKPEGAALLSEPRLWPLCRRLTGSRPAAETLSSGRRLSVGRPGGAILTNDVHQLALDPVNIRTLFSRSRIPFGSETAPPASYVWSRWRRHVWVGELLNCLDPSEYGPRALAARPRPLSN